MALEALRRLGQVAARLREAPPSSRVVDWIGAALPAHGAPLARAHETTLAAVSSARLGRLVAGGTLTTTEAVLLSDGLSVSPPVQALESGGAQLLQVGGQNLEPLSIFGAGIVIIIFGLVVLRDILVGPDRPEWSSINLLTRARDRLFGPERGSRENMLQLERRLDRGWSLDDGARVLLLRDVHLMSDETVLSVTDLLAERLVRDELAGSHRNAKKIMS